MLLVRYTLNFPHISLTTMSRYCSQVVVESTPSTFAPYCHFQPAFNKFSNNMSDPAQPDGGHTTESPSAAPTPAEHLNIKVTDGNNEVFFKIKRSTKLEKLMHAFCDRQGKQFDTVRFLFDGERVQKTDSPDTVSRPGYTSSISPRLYQADITTA